MADWGQAATTLGAVALGGAIGSISTWLAGKQQGKNQLEQLRLQHAIMEPQRVEDRVLAQMQEERRRRREVRSEPLLAFRAELANWAQKLDYVTLAEGWRFEPRTDADDPDFEVQYQKAHKEWLSYIDSGAFKRALFQLTDEEILKKTEEVSHGFWTSGIKSESRKGIQAKVAELQELVNQRLEAL